MKSISITAIVGVSVAAIVGIIYFTNFDANLVPTGLLDTIPVGKTISDGVDKLLINTRF